MLSKMARVTPTPSDDAASAHNNQSGVQDFRSLGQEHSVVQVNDGRMLRGVGEVYPQDVFHDSVLEAHTNHNDRLRPAGI